MTAMDVTIASRSSNTLVLVPMGSNVWPHSSRDSWRTQRLHLRLYRCVWQRCAHGAQLHGVGAWLQYGDDALVAHAFSQAVDRGGNRGGVVCEIVIEIVMPSISPLDFHAPRHAVEFVERIDGELGGHATRGALRRWRPRRSWCCARHQAPIDDAFFGAVHEHGKLAVTLATLEVPQQPGAEFLDWCPVAFWPALCERVRRGHWRR